MILTAAAVLIYSAAPASAGLFGPSDLEKCRNAKVATGLKLKYCYKDKAKTENQLAALKKQFRNERANLTSNIRDLENNVASLKKQLQASKDQQSDEKQLAAARIAQLEKTIAILKQNSSQKEQDLLTRLKAMEKRYEKEVNHKLAQLRSERERYLREIADLRKNHAVEITKLQGVIDRLNDELSSLKKLTTKQKEELERLVSQERELEKQLQKEIKNGEIRLKKFHNKLIINIDNRISFDSGSAKLKKDVRPALKKIARILNDYPENQIVIEGHTDTDKIIGGKRFQDNWELSTERALAVLRFVLRNKNLDKSRFSAAGYGEFNPIVPNTTGINKALNRRVDIVVIPRVSKK